MNNTLGKRRDNWRCMLEIKTESWFSFVFAGGASGRSIGTKRGSVFTIPLVTDLNSVQQPHSLQEQISKVQLLVSVTVSVANAALERQVARDRLDGMDWGSRMFPTDDCTWQKHCAELVCVPVSWQTQIHHDNTVATTAVSGTFCGIEQQRRRFLSELELWSWSTRCRCNSLTADVAESLIWQAGDLQKAARNVTCRNVAHAQLSSFDFNTVFMIVAWKVKASRGNFTA